MEINHGLLASECGKQLTLQVMKSARGYYIGTSDDGMPCSRESVEYYSMQSDASDALRDGSWTQRESP